MTKYSEPDHKTVIAKQELKSSTLPTDRGTHDNTHRFLLLNIVALKPIILDYCTKTLDSYPQQVILHTGKEQYC